MILQDWLTGRRHRPQHIAWVIQAEHLQFLTTSKVPIKSVSFKTNDGRELVEQSHPGQVLLGVNPVHVYDVHDFQSSYTLSLIREDGPCDRRRLLLVPQLSNVPKALWYPDQTDLNSHAVIEGVFTGFQIVPKVLKPDKTLPVRISSLQKTSLAIDF